jgi:ABC-type transport system involved in multi-copper enzyme maturation permease subunit
MAMLAKEFRGRMRSWRSVLIITVYLTSLGIIGLGTVINIRDNGQNTGLNAASMGPLIFGALAEFQLVLIAFVAPALTGAAIAGEKERQTYDLLLVTRLSAPSIVLGKLMTSLAYLLLLLLLSMPFYMLAFLFGGVNLGEFVLTQLILIVTGLTLGGLGLAISSIIAKPQIATTLAYIVAFGLVLGSGIFGSLLTNNAVSVNQLGQAGYAATTRVAMLPSPPLLANLSPLAAVATSVTTPFGAAVNIPFFQLPTGLPTAYFSYSNFNGYSAVSNRYSATRLSNETLPLTYPSFLASYSVISVGSLTLSMLFVRPKRRLRWVRYLLKRRKRYGY